jgi:hypothetical protein
MALTVISFATYKRPPYNPDEWHSLKFVKAIKGKPFNGYGDVPVLGRVKRLTPQNAEDSVDWFAELAAAQIVTLGLPGPLVLVPLPNSSSTTKNGKVPRTAVLAAGIAAKLKGAIVWDGLRWLKEMTPTHQGGTRDPQILYENLAISGTPPRGTIVLVDDVYTRGGHLQAAVAKLALKKAICKVAVCAGRTVLDSQDNPFLTLQEEIADFTPRR